MKFEYLRHLAAMDDSIRNGQHMIPIVIGLSVILELAGCGRSDGIERVPLSGTITFQRIPVADGQIRFVPQSGTSAPLTIAPIQDGQYDTGIVGGVPVGMLRVEIQSFDPATPAPRGPGDPQRNQLLPAKFNTESALELEIDPKKTHGIHDFHLQP